MAKPWLHGDGELVNLGFRIGCVSSAAFRLPTLISPRVEDAKENLGENEVREALLAKADYFISIGDKVCLCRKTYHVCQHVAEPIMSQTGSAVGSSTGKICSSPACSLIYLLVE